jgi:hypothetical protein
MRTLGLPFAPTGVDARGRRRRCALRDRRWEEGEMRVEPHIWGYVSPASSLKTWEVSLRSGRRVGLAFVDHVPDALEKGGAA